MNLNQVTLPVNDFDQSVAFYRTMGFELIVHSPPRYARFECPEGDSTFSLHSVTGLTRCAGVVVYFECADLDDRVDRLLAAGLEFTQLPTNESWLWREARLVDPSGNVICLFWAGDNRKNPPWRVAAQEFIQAESAAGRYPVECFRLYSTQSRPCCGFGVLQASSVH